MGLAPAREASVHNLSVGSWFLGRLGQGGKKDEFLRGTPFEPIAMKDFHQNKLPEAAIDILKIL